MSFNNFLNLFRLDIPENASIGTLENELDKIPMFPVYIIKAFKTFISFLKDKH